MADEMTERLFDGESGNIHKGVRIITSGRYANVFM